MKLLIRTHNIADDPKSLFVKCFSGKSIQRSITQSRNPYCFHYRSIQSFSTFPYSLFNSSSPSLCLVKIPLKCLKYFSCLWFRSPTMEKICTLNYFCRPTKVKICTYKVFCRPTKGKNVPGKSFVGLQKRNMYLKTVL